MWAKAAELSLTGTNAVLKVHLVGDPATSYYLMPLTAGNRTSALFDKIIQSGTTVTLANIVLFMVEAQ
jgi:hypothetical protein